MLRWGDIFLTLANFWTFAPLHLRKQSARSRPQPCLVLTLEAKPSHFLMQGPLCVYCVCAIVFDRDCMFLCVLCLILSQFHSQKMPPMYSQNMGFVVTPLKKLKSLSRQKRSVEAHKYSCGYATDGSLFIQQLKASVLLPETFLFSPTGGSLYHLAGDPEHLSQPKAEGNAPRRAMLGNSEL